MNHDEQINQIGLMLLAIAEKETTYEAERQEAAKLFKEQQSKKLAVVAEALRELAETVVATNSQALRKRIIRTLYWETNVKASLIGDAFGVNQHKVYMVAGPFIEVTACEGGCGAQVKREYHSQSDRGGPHKRNSKHRIPILCEQCSIKQRVKSNAEYEKEVARDRVLAAAYCAEHGHSWIGGDFDEDSPTIEIVCGRWCGATMERRVSGD